MQTVNREIIKAIIENCLGEQSFYELKFSSEQRLQALIEGREYQRIELLNSKDLLKYRVNINEKEIEKLFLSIDRMLQRISEKEAEIAESVEEFRIQIQAVKSSILKDFLANY